MPVTSCILFSFSVVSVSLPREELHDVRRAVKTGNRAALRQRRSIAQWGLTARMIRVALAVYCLSKYRKDCAMEFAMQARKRRRVQMPEDEEERDCPIRQWFLDANLDDVATVFMPETQYESAIRTEAVKFLAERQTVEWVAAQNFKHGKAPTAISLVSNFSARLRALGVEPPFRLDPPRAGRGPKLGRTARRWCQKMRSKWGLRRRSLAEAEFMTRDEVVSKARGPLTPK